MTLNKGEVMRRASFVTAFLTVKGIYFYVKDPHRWHVSPGPFSFHGLWRSQTTLSAGPPPSHGLGRALAAAQALPSWPQASPVLAQGLCSTPTSGAVARGSQAQGVWSTGSVALRNVGSSWIRDGKHISCVGRFTSKSPGKPEYYSFTDERNYTTYELRAQIMFKIFKILFIYFPFVFATHHTKCTV